jgi:hypothetical protein
MKEILSGHTSPETAYVVADYPYGFRLRCQIRYWLEHHPKRGTRLWSQTTNPKRGNVWNKPKASTYADVAGCMFLDDVGHVTWSTLNIYSGAAEASAWLDTFGPFLDEPAAAKANEWLLLKRTYEAARADNYSAAASSMIATLVCKRGKSCVEARAIVDAMLAKVAAQNAAAPTDLTTAATLLS